MLFTVWKDGECKMGTDAVTCIYPHLILKSMNAAGYSFKWNDKKISLKALEEELRKEKDYSRD